MMNKVLVLLFSIFLNITLFAEDFEGPSLNRDVEKPVCDVEVKRCVYYTSNITGRQFVTRVTTQLFPQQSIFFTDGSYLEVESGNTVVFWFEEDEILKRFKLLIPYVDALESFKPVDMVKVTTEIVEMTETGLKNLRAQITAVTMRTPGSLGNFSGGISDANNGDLSFNIPLKTVDLSVVLGASSVRRHTKRAITNESYITNFENINFSDTTFVPFEGPSGILEKQTGLTINGSVSIERDNSDLVKISNFDLKYEKSVVNPVDDTMMSVNSTDVDRASMFLYRGLTQTTVKSISSASSTDGGIQLNGFNRSTGEEYNKLLILVRAESISQDDIAGEARRIADSVIRGNFTDQQIRNFDTTPVEIDEVLEDIKPFSRFGTTGERIIGFKLNPELARDENYKKRFDIKIRGGGIKQEANRSLEELMTRGLVLSDIRQRYLDKKYIKIKVSFKEFIKGPRGNTRPLFKRVTLYYNPQTNKFI